MECKEFLKFYYGLRFSNNELNIVYEKMKEQNVDVSNNMNQIKVEFTLRVSIILMHDDE